MNQDNQHGGLSPALVAVLFTFLVPLPGVGVPWLITRWQM
jgi:hypothetical protein